MDQLPGNRQAERGLLGILLTNNDSLFGVGPLIKADFSEPYNGELFILIKDQVEAGRTVTASTLLFDVQDAPIWGDIRASEYLARLEMDAPPPSLATELATTIRDAALRARIISAADEVKRRVIAAPVSIPAAELREQMDEALAALFPSVGDMGLLHQAIVGDRVLERIKTAGESPIGYDVGLKALQDLTGALQPGRLYMVGGSPGSGKSSLLTQVLRYLARCGRVSLLFTPEMGADEVVERNLAADTEIEAGRIERALVNNEEYERLWIANEATRPAEFYIDQSSKPSLAMIRGRALRKARMGGLHALAIDHVHYLAKPDRRMSENDALDENLEGLKGLAKDLGVPVVAACQLGTEAVRDMAKWPHRRPTQGDLLYAGIVERHADAIVLVHRQEYFLKRNEPDKTDRNYSEWSAKVMEMEGAAELILTKRRGGKGWGSRRCGFNAERTIFTEGVVSAYRREAEGFFPGLTEPV